MESHYLEFYYKAVAIHVQLLLLCSFSYCTEVMNGMNIMQGMNGCVAH